MQSIIGEKIRQSLLVIICFFLWSGCNVINPHETIPTYIHIDSFAFANKNATLVQSLTKTHQITLVWVYYNNSPVGVFDLPCTIPIMASGSGQLEVFPGIAVDGLNSLTGVYPFYMPDTSLSFTAKPGKVITYEPITDFYPNVKVTRISNFHSQTGFANESGNIPMIRVDSSTLNFEEAVGSIYLTNPGVDSSEDSTLFRFNIPKGSAFIEFNYKCSIGFAVGLRSNLSNVVYFKTYLGGAFPTDHWQKFYLSAADFVAQHEGDNYNFYIKTSLPQGPPGRVLLDNIQLVTF
jgi:hypothetical protein